MNSSYLLTSIQGIPVIIECETQEQIEEFSNKNSVFLGKSCAEANLKSGGWTNKTKNKRVYELLQKHLSEVNCWIRVEDAKV